MSKKLWGGRFKKEINQEFFDFQKSIHYDYKLAQYDVCHSLIHLGALLQAKILKKNEYNKLIKVLVSLLTEIRTGKFVFSPQAEDIHTDIQNRVEKKVGKLANKLHSLRSRNDQIVFDEKWYCFHEAVGLLISLNDLLDALEELSKKYKDCHLPGYTHTQRAQVVGFSDYIGAFFSMFTRDFERLDAYLRNIRIAIGSAALAGSSLSHDYYTKAIKDFMRIWQSNATQSPLEIAQNSLDNVASRDFVVELLCILAMLQMHLSRMAEDFILYSTSEFRFFDLPEEFCTGSSLMPHKKNPDFLELVRGYTGRINGNLVAMFTLMKGLPLTYNRDMQLDKEPLFSSVEILGKELLIMKEFIKGIKINKERIKEVLKDESLYATELVEFLVYQGVAFKDAHTIIGRLVRYSIDNKKFIRDLNDNTLKKFHSKLSHEQIVKIMCSDYAVSSKKSTSRKLPQRGKKRR